MAPMDLLRLIAWISVLFWGIWHVNVQLERLNRGVFENTKSTVRERLATSTGFYHIVAVVLYSPYVHPVKTTFCGLSILIVLFVL